MKKVLIFLLSAAVLPLMGQITTPAASPFCKIEQKIGLGTMTIEYSRPSKKNRIVFGDLVPYEKMWRTGANATTKITFSDDVKVEGQNVPKGTYVLFSIPGEYQWHIMLYSDVNISASGENYDPAKEVAHFTVSPELIPYTVESFTIDVNDLRNESATVNLIWETTMVTFSVTFDSDSKVMSIIDKIMAGPTSNDYFQAARYFYDTNRDMNIALGWIQKSTQTDPQFWKLRVEALILARLGRKAEAIAVAERSKAMAIIAKNEEYVKMNDISIKEWSN
jgi:hypothetical protein